MKMTLRSDLELKYYLGLHNEDLLFTKDSVLFDIIEFFVKIKKENQDSFKFTSKTLKYIFGDKLGDENLKIKIVSYIKDLIDSGLFERHGESILITNNAINKFYTT
jgi:hypothetical protein